MSDRARRLRILLRSSLRLLPYLILTFVFVASRLVYRMRFRVAFDAEPVTYFIQYIPVWILKHDFWRSILYIHEQAPFQNLLAGGLWVALGAGRATSVLEAIYLGFGYTFSVCLLASMQRLGIGRVFATIAASIYVASPIAVLYECWLFYHMPVVTCLGLALYGLLRFYEKGTYRSGLFFFSMLALAALFRSVYGPVWIGGIMVALLLCPPREAGGPARKASNPISSGSPKGTVWWRRWLFSPSPRRTVILAAVLPILVVEANGIRTTLLLGHDFSDAPVWANVSTKIFGYLPSTEQQQLTSEGVLSEAVVKKIEPFSPLPTLGSLRIPHEDTGVTLLDMEVTPDGEPNYFTREYLLIVDKYYKADGKYLLAHYPWVYLESVLDGFRDWYCSPPTRDLVMSRSRNLKRVSPIENKLEKWSGKSPSGHLKALQYGLPFCFLYGIYRLLRPRARAESERSRTAATLFMLATIAYAGVGTTMISYADFSRYRFDVDPFYVTLFTLFLTDAARVFALGLRRAWACLPRIPHLRTSLT